MADYAQDRRSKGNLAQPVRTRTADPDPCDWEGPWRYTRLEHGPRSLTCLRALGLWAGGGLVPFAAHDKTQPRLRPRGAQRK